MHEMNQDKAADSLSGRAAKVALSAALALSCTPAIALANEAEECMAGVERSGELLETADSQACRADQEEQLGELEEVGASNPSEQADLDKTSSILSEAPGQGGYLEQDMQAAAESAPEVQGAATSYGMADAGTRAAAVPGDQGPYEVGAYIYAGTFDDPVRIVKGKTTPSPFKNGSVDGYFVGSDPWSSQDDYVYANRYSGLQGKKASPAGAPTLVSGKTMFGSAAIESIYVLVVATEAELDPNPSCTHTVRFDWNISDSLLPYLTALPELPSPVEAEEGEAVPMPEHPALKESCLIEPQPNEGYKVVFEGWSVDDAIVDSFVMGKADVIVKAVWSVDRIDLSAPGARGPYAVGDAVHAGTEADPIIIMEGETISVTGAIGNDDPYGFGDAWFVDGNEAYGSNCEYVEKGYTTTRTVALTGKKASEVVVPIAHTFTESLTSSAKKAEVFYVKVVKRVQAEPTVPVEPEPVEPEPEPTVPVEPEPVEPEPEPMAPAEPAVPAEPAASTNPVVPMTSLVPTIPSLSGIDALNSSGGNRGRAASVLAGATGVMRDSFAPDAAVEPLSIASNALNAGGAHQTISDDGTPMAASAASEPASSFGILSSLIPPALLAALASAFWFFFAQRRKHEQETA